MSKSTIRSIPQYHTGFGLFGSPDPHYILPVRYNPASVNSSYIRGNVMADAVVASKEPFAVEVEAGKIYSWCACGRSENQPFCDGSHSGTDIKPVNFKAENSETVYLCGCKQTGSPPFCDGTHNNL